MLCRFPVPHLKAGRFPQAQKKTGSLRPGLVSVVSVVVRSRRLPRARLASPGGQPRNHRLPAMKHDALPPGRPDRPPATGPA
jgi:hypothetical protein